MSRATVTVRELKNKETGIDLFVTSFKVTKGMVGSTYEYEVVVVSNLQVFKSAKHKEADTVQFTFLKKFGEFEDIYAKLNAKFSGTALPALSKKVLMMSDSVAKERRNNLDSFLKFIAANEKISTSSLLLEFLGVSSMRSGKLENLQGASNPGETTPSDTGKAGDDEEESQEPEAEEIDMFADKLEEKDDDDDGDLFADESADDTFGGDGVQVFDELELGGAVSAGEDQGLFLADALPSTDSAPPTVHEPDEEDDNEDLFRIDDDLDQIMQLKLTPDKSAVVTDETVAERPDTADKDENVVEVPDTAVTEVTIAEVPDTEQPEVPADLEKADVEEPVAAKTPPTKPGLKPKPDIKQKPNLPKKPSVPTTANNPKIASDQTSPHSAAPKPGLKPKPDIKQKPSLPKKPSLSSKENNQNKTGDSGKDMKAEVSAISSKDASKADVKEAGDEDLTQDDVMKYIQANAAADEEVSLFD